MEIKSLSGVNVSKITQAFNEAFSDYFFPFVLKEEEMLSKIISENIIWNFQQVFLMSINSWDLFSQE
jgi:hypothetical protein